MLDAAKQRGKLFRKTDLRDIFSCPQFFSGLYCRLNVQLGECFRQRGQNMQIGIFVHRRRRLVDDD